MFVINFGLILMISVAANCDINKNVSSSEENDYEHFKTLATNSHGGLGVAYVRHQMEKHGDWYHRKRHDRTKMFQSSKLQTSVVAKPIAPFKVNDISEDYRDQMVGIGVGINLLKKAGYYSDENVRKSADSALYLNMKLRPSKSEVIPRHKFTKTEIENMLVTINGTTIFLESVRRLNPEYFKNLTSDEIAAVQSIRNGKILSHNVTKLSANLTKPILHGGKLAEYKPVPLLIRQLNNASSLHQPTMLLFIFALVTMNNGQHYC